MLSAVRRVAGIRQAATRSMATTSIVERVHEVVPEQQAAVGDIMKKYGDYSLGEVTVSQAVGGARGVKCMLWETSLLDAEEGIEFRNHTIPELQEKLPKLEGGEEPQPEGLLWLLLTDEIPSKEQVDALTAELHERSTIPDSARKAIDALPVDMHPMTQLCSAVLACQTESKFSKAYMDGVHKSEFWKYTLEDSLDLIAKLPELAALIYNRSFKGNPTTAAAYDKSLDYSANFNRMLGYTDPMFDELMRLYLTIHTDHEGGNVSAHATHLVGSALSDPYLSFNAGMAGLAGPLHGLANQEVLGWIMNLDETFKARGQEVTHDSIREFAWETLNGGKVIPGYGHAVLRRTDPRYSCQREFALKHLGDDRLFKIVSTIYEVVPDVLLEHGKTKNPWPNVDAHSGVLLQYYGFTEHNYYTVLFGVSRAMGVLSQLVWDRALGLPIERPKSVTSAWIKDYCEAKDRQQQA